MRAPLEQAIAGVDKDPAVTDVRTLEELKSESLTSPCLRSSLVGLFAASALALAAMGIYGVIAYTVVQRTHELGVRAALGASAASLVSLIVRVGMRPTALGLGLGSIATLGVVRLLRTFLFDVAPSDAVTWMATAGTLAVVAGLACYLPARRVTRIDPLIALRAE